MSDLRKALESKVSDEGWQRMAASANMSIADVKEKILPALEDCARKLSTEVETKRSFLEAMPIISDVTADGNCHSISFAADLHKIIGVSGTVTLCGTSIHDWSARVQICLVVAGAEVWCENFEMGADNLKYCVSPNMGIAKADICFSLEFSSKMCFRITGEACIWALGWHCGNVDVTPFCIPLPWS